MSRLARMGEIEGGGQQGDMREGLREIAHQPSGPRIVFLCQQPEIVTQGEQTLE